MESNCLIVPVVLAGGSGTRLWPLSRKKRPKQFLKLNSENTMLQDTLLRLDGLVLGTPVVICNDAHRFLAGEQLEEVSIDAQIILEPVGRNTAPAIAIAALNAVDQGEDPLLLILAADHVIKDEEEFRKQVQVGSELAQKGKLVTFGIVPDQPSTGYGYIRKGTAIVGGSIVAEFVEKPDIETAKEYLSTGAYLWNSGMFLIKASRYLEELRRYRPDILSVCEKSFATSVKDLDFLRLDESVFKECPDESVDYAVMEKTADAVVVPLDAGWSDVGSWSSLWEVSEKDSDGNAIAGDVVNFDSHDCVIRSTRGLVATVGVSDLVIVATKDSVLVGHKDRDQEIKSIVDTLKKNDRPEYEFHRIVYRPWGHYDSVDESDGYKVKRITVKPGAKLSVQKHLHRSEHWVVVSGSARVTRDEECFDLEANQSIYLPKESVHALENIGSSLLELIEVQVGSYLGEDDIIRFQDIYGRAE
ncbi:MAG: mannose-1-phosphate guanylyltransferase/mannose-6-phosphate isomerase [Oceanospirillaceae bacterium]|nr:mannose-1-phosphate guanylyltransferase/mannose-6-phosphate isomerase [Oceanospirillaceae bacterium]